MRSDVTKPYEGFPAISNPHYRRHFFTVTDALPFSGCNAPFVAGRNLGLTHISHGAKNLQTLLGPTPLRKVTTAPLIRQLTAALKQLQSNYEQLESTV